MTIKEYAEFRDRQASVVGLAVCAALAVVAILVVATKVYSEEAPRPIAHQQPYCPAHLGVVVTPAGPIKVRTFEPCSWSTHYADI
jgi:hypothetical protein